MDAAPARVIIRRAVAALALAASLLLPASACRRGPDPGRPNVLLITVDTLRPDHLGAWGYDVPTSPALDAFAREGVRVQDCITSAPETAPGAASIVSGLYQHRNKVAFNRQIMSPHVTTLAERLQVAGWTTAGFVSNLFVDREHGFAQGYDRFELFEPAKGSFEYDRLGVDLALGWLAEAPREPWHLWLHLFDPHGPYNSADPAVSAAFVYPPDRVAPNDPLPIGTGNFGLGVIPRYQMLRGLDRPLDYLRRYDGEIRSTDTQLARLFAALAARGLDRRTLVVVTADHGESLTEHNQFFQHGWFVYDPTARVPLLYRWPGVLPAGGTVAAQTSVVDIVPTIGELVGVPVAAADVDGASIAPALHGQPVPSRPAFVVGPRENHPFAIRADGWKLIWTPPGRPTVPGGRVLVMTGDAARDRFELYDLARDPGELRNLAAEDPARVQAMLAPLKAFRDAFRATGPRW